LIVEDQWRCLTQVAEFYGNFDPLVARVQKMLEEAKTVERNQVSQYLGN
jgi:hypothetical protein